MTNTSVNSRKILNSSSLPVLFAATLSLAICILGLLLMSAGDNAANFGVMLLVAMPGIIGFVLALRYYGVHAWLWTAAISAISMIAAAKATVGLSALIVLEFLAELMFAASLVGVIAGILSRPFLPRKKRSA